MEMKKVKVMILLVIGLLAAKDAGAGGGGLTGGATEVTVRP
jgi:hypothetical protein